MLLRLTTDVANPKPDRRKKYEYEARPVWKAGTLFIVREDHGFEIGEHRVGNYLYLTRPNRGDRFGPTSAGYAPLLQAAEEIAPTLGSVIDVSPWTGNFGPACQHVVEHLLKLKRISLDDVREMLEIEDDDDD